MPWQAGSRNARMTISHALLFRRQSKQPTTTQKEVQLIEQRFLKVEPEIGKILLKSLPVLLRKGLLFRLPRVR